MWSSFGLVRVWEELAFPSNPDMAAKSAMSAHSAQCAVQSPQRTAHSSQRTAHGARRTAHSAQRTERPIMLLAPIMLVAPIMLFRVNPLMGVYGSAVPRVQALAFYNDLY